MSESADLFNEQSSLGIVRPSRIHKISRILRICTLIFSTLTLALIIANAIILAIAPFSYPYWQSRINEKVIGWFIASFITSVVAIYAPIPVLISFATDLAFSVGVIICMVRWIDNMPFSDCSHRYDGRSKTWIPPHPKCKDYKLALNIIMGFTAAFGILLAASYVCLLLLRAYQLLKDKVWNRVPTGEITWSVSLNVVTDGHERTFGFSVGAKADSRATQGPVHL